MKSLTVRYSVGICILLSPSNSLVCLWFSPFETKRWLTFLTENKKRQAEHQEEGQLDVSWQLGVKQGLVYSETWGGWRNKGTLMQHIQNAYLQPRGGGHSFSSKVKRGWDYPAHVLLMCTATALPAVCSCHTLRRGSTVLSSHSDISSSLTLPFRFLHACTTSCSCSRTLVYICSSS